jgi:hypothetical protein
MLLSVATLLLATGATHAGTHLNDRDPDWIFSCSGHGDVFIYHEGQITFTVRGVAPPFQLSWAEDREPVLTVGNEKCELIYPVEQG